MKLGQSPILDLAKKVRQGKGIVGVDLAKAGNDTTVAFTKAPTNPYADVSFLKFLDQPSLTPADFRLMYQGDFRDMPTLKPGQLTPFNFVEAYEEARREWEGEVDFSLWVKPREVGRHNPQMLHDWLWGPKGEFTGFAKVRAFERIDRKLVNYPEGKTYEDVELEEPGVPGAVRFNITTIYSRNMRRYSYGDPRGLDSCMTFVRFATYDAYTAWERFAASDPLGRERRDYAYRD